MVAPTSKRPRPMRTDLIDVLGEREREREKEKKRSTSSRILQRRGGGGKSEIK